MKPFLSTRALLLSRGLRKIMCAIFVAFFILFLLEIVAKTFRPLMLLVIHDKDFASCFFFVLFFFCFWSFIYKHVYLSTRLSIHVSIAYRSLYHFDFEIKNFMFYQDYLRLTFSISLIKNVSILS